MNTAQRAFSGGEVSPSLYARTDVARYQSACRTLRNFIVKREGGATNRPGTELVAVLAGAGSRLLPFVFNDDQAYILEFTNASLRIYRSGGALGVTVVSPYLTADLAGLQIVQSADVAWITSAAHPVYELRRTSELVWTLTAAVFGPGIAIPAAPALNLSTATLGTDVNWVVTAISDATGEESYPSTPTGINSSVTSPLYVGLLITGVPGATSYNIYKAIGTGSYGFVGSTSTLSPFVGPSYTFLDQGLSPDYASQPPPVRTLFAAVGDYPSVLGRYQQRNLYAGTDNGPETLWASRTGAPRNLTVSVPIQDDDAITFTLASRKINRIRHIVDCGVLFLLTSGGEWEILGDQSGTIRPTDINARNFSQHGASRLIPIVLDSRVLFVQARQSVVREIRVGDVGVGYQGVDRTVFSAHLFAGTSLVDWTYAETPHSIVWCVRSDGTLVALTDYDEQKVSAWHRHDTDGIVENVCAIPEGGEDRLYLVVQRNGVRCLERMASRYYTDVADAVFVDSSLAYDGRNTSGRTMTLSGGVLWESGELLTITDSGALFTPAEVGNVIIFTGALDGIPVRFTLENYVSAGVMTGHADRTVPNELTLPATAWSRAVETVTGLSHLEGKSVSATGDGYVAASVSNPQFAPVVVTGGAVTLDKAYARIRVGLPYTCDLGTLDIDTPSGQSLKDSRMLVNGALLYLEASRSAFVGQDFATGADPIENMDELKVRDPSDDYGLIALHTEAIEVTVGARWNNTGRIAVRHIDPSPLTILAAIPQFSRAG